MPLIFVLTFPSRVEILLELVLMVLVSVDMFASMVLTCADRVEILLIFVETFPSIVEMLFELVDILP